MKLTIIAMEIPYPPIHGGRVDIWRRLEALKHLGVEVQLVCWTPQPPEPADLAILQQAVSHLQVLDYTGRTPLTLLRRCFDLLSYPLGITSRMVYGQSFKHLVREIQTFKPDLLMVDGFNASILTRQLSRVIGIPFVIRSHNIEHQHRSALLKAAQGLQKISAFLTLAHVKTLEVSIFKEALAFFDISVDDLRFWQDHGFKNGYFLPPLAEQPQKTPLKIEVRSYDVVFLGNLNRENNVAGIRWFLTDVFPRIKSKKSDFSVLIAGSNPVQSIQTICSITDDVDLEINPESIAKIYELGKVLINPIAVGGGVSIKSIDMLATGKPIVSLDKGIYGLPDSVRSLFSLATDEQSFADQVLACLVDDAKIHSVETHSVETHSVEAHSVEAHSAIERQMLINTVFGLPGIELFIQQLQHIIDNHCRAKVLM